MKIAELFRSVQGEGQLTGVESVFVRTSGCNLRCWFCDTPYTSWQPEGEDLSVEEILAAVVGHVCGHVVITGGEPMLHAELVPLTVALRKLGMHVTIETAGTLDLPVECDLMSISPKLANSTPDALEHPRWSRRHELARHRPDVLRRLVSDYPYQLKFVIDRAEDCDDVERFLTELPEVARQYVWLMPQARTEAELAERGPWLRQLCQERGLLYCPRRQIEWFGMKRGT